MVHDNLTTCLTTIFITIIENKKCTLKFNLRHTITFCDKNIAHILLCEWNCTWLFTHIYYGQGRSYMEAWEHRLQHIFIRALHKWILFQKKQLPFLSFTFFLSFFVLEGNGLVPHKHAKHFLRRYNSFIELKKVVK